jgi:hypothetical protein
MGAFSISDFAYSNSWSTVEDRRLAYKQNGKVRKKAEAILFTKNPILSNIMTKKKKNPSNII